MLTTVERVAMDHGIAPDELPATPDDIDLDRIVTDPRYRGAVKALLRTWRSDAAGPGGPDQEAPGA